MFLSFGLVVNVILFAIGVVWCREMFGRWRSDLDEFRTTEDSGIKGVLVVLWLLTALIALGVIEFALGILRGLGLF